MKAWKKCNGTDQLPHEFIKYQSQWCPMCAAMLRMENYRTDVDRLRSKRAATIQEKYVAETYMVP
jgi:hypothetical protein